MPERELTEMDVHLQEGGAVEIKHGHITVMAPRNDVLQAIIEWRSMMPAEKRRALRNVRRAITDGTRLSDRDELGQEGSIQLAQDIAIWHANEIVEGRAKL